MSRITKTPSRPIHRIVCLSLPWAAPLRPLPFAACHTLACCPARPCSQPTYGSSWPTYVLAFCSSCGYNVCLGSPGLEISVTLSWLTRSRNIRTSTRFGIGRWNGAAAVSVQCNGCANRGCPALGPPLGLAGLGRPGAPLSSRPGPPPHAAWLLRWSAPGGCIKHTN